MKKVLLALVLLAFIASCKKNTTGSGGGNVDISTLHERLPGKWNIVSITYDGNGMLPPPFDPTQLVTFTGTGENVSGYYDFDTIPNPNEMEFLMDFDAPLDFTAGGSVTMEIHEEGYATYEVNEDESLLEGISYISQPSGDVDTVPSEWTVLKNELNRQEWGIKKTVYWDYDPNYPIYIDMVTVIER